MTRGISLCWIIALTVLAGAHQAAAQGTAFTYQGSLSVDAAPANGFFDFEFKLYTNATGAGTQVSSNLTQTSIGVTNGLFTTALDFGDVFTGNATWLALSVRTNGGSSFTALNPFQELTPTPYAMYAPIAGTAASANTVAATNITGALALAQLPSTVVTNDEGSVALGNVTVNGNLNLASPATIDSGGKSLLLSIGNNNFYAGPGAGNLTNTGSANTGVGSQSLQSNTNGTNNTAFGYLTLGGNMSGSYNTATGERALADNTGGNGNTADGRHAMINNTTGSDNVAMGYAALGLSTNDSELVAIGYQALQNDNAVNSNSTASGNGENTAIGYNALHLNTFGTANTAIGFQSLPSNTSGIYNTAVGDNALSQSTIGSFNTAAGAYALLRNTIGTNNTAIGQAALINNTTGLGNTAIGDLALYDNEAGTNNIGVGYQAGALCNFGNNNIYIGNTGDNGDNAVIRIGTTGVQDNNTFMAGIYGTALPSGLGAPVFIDPSGQLGTAGVTQFGSFTPTIGDGTHSFTVFTQQGYFTITGNLVYFEVWLQWSKKGSATGGDNLQISLPVPVVPQRPAFPLGFTSGISFGSQLVAFALNGESYISLNSLSNSGGSPPAVLVSSCSASGEIQISGTYRWQ